MEGKSRQYWSVTAALLIALVALAAALTSCSHKSAEDGTYLFTIGHGEGAGRSSLRQAERFVLEGDYNAARPVLSALVRSKHKKVSIRALRVQAVMHFAMGQPQRMKEDFLVLTKKQPQEGAYFLNLAAAELMLREIGAAKKSLSQGEKLAPEGSLLVRQISMMSALIAGKSTKVDSQTIQKVLKSENSFPMTLAATLYLMISGPTQTFSQSLGQLETLTKTQGSAPAPYAIFEPNQLIPFQWTRGIEAPLVALLKARKTKSPKDALAAANQIIKTSPHIALGYAVKAYAIVKMQAQPQNTAQVNSLLAKVRDTPKYSYLAPYFTARAYEQLGAASLAQKALSESLARSFPFPALRRSHGQLSYRIGDLKASAQDFQMLLSSPRRKAGDFAMLAKIQLAQGDGDKVARTYAQGLKAFPKSGILAVGYGYYLFMRGEKEKARALVDPILSTAKKPQVYLQLSRLYSDMHEQGLAQRALRKYQAGVALKAQP